MRRNLRARSLIYRAIAAGDPDAAERTMREHLVAARTNIVSYLRGEEAAQPAP